MALPHREVDVVPSAAPRATALVRTGWVLLLLIPVAFVAATLLGEWLLSVQGHDAGESELPVSVMLRAGVPAVLVMVAPPGLAAWCGWRARGRGDVRGVALLVVGLTLGLGLAALNLAPLLLRAVV